jgi:small subunit ribosomal protein S5
VVREYEIFENLLPTLADEVISIDMVQKMTEAGQQARFKCTVVVGNQDGYVGLGVSKSKEVGPGIRRAIIRAKLNIIPIKRGCGSWECVCGGNHSIPYRTSGKMGSVKIELLPAPKGVGLVCSDTAKVVLRLAGISDVWTKTSGNTRNASNMAKAVFEALKNTYKTMTPEDWRRI